MNKEQLYIYDGLRELVALANTQDSLSIDQITEPIIRYLVTAFSILKGYDRIGPEHLSELVREYETTPQTDNTRFNYISAVLLQSLNILNMTLSVRATNGEEHERTIPNLQDEGRSPGITDSIQPGRAQDRGDLPRSQQLY